jgi:hypothetical protein
MTAAIRVVSWHVGVVDAGAAARRLTVLAGHLDERQRRFWCWRWKRWSWVVVG